MEEKKKGLFGKKAERADVLPEDTTPNIKYFFKLLWRKLGKLTSLNLMMLFQFAPLVAVVLIYFFSDTVATVESPLFAPLLGVEIAGGSPLSSLLLGTASRQLDVPMLTQGRMIAIGILLLVMALTWGWQNVGATYNLRSLIRGDSCFLMSDYFYAIKRNLKQGFFFGLLDFAIIGVLIFDFIYAMNYTETFLFGVTYVMSIVLAFIYMVMRFYIYHMMITFDLSIRKLLKNALIFVTLGFKRNIVAVLALALLFVLNALAISFGLSVNFAVPLILPLFYLPALCGFIAGYAAWPNIQKYMIDAYEEKHPKSLNEDDEVEEREITAPPTEAD